jgi:hypothetical protein
MVTVCTRLFNMNGKGMSGRDYTSCQGNTAHGWMDGWMDGTVHYNQR